MALVFTNQTANATSAATTFTTNLLVVQITGTFGTALVQTILTSDAKDLAVRNDHAIAAFAIVGAPTQSIKFVITNANAATNLTVSII